MIEKDAHQWMTIGELAQRSGVTVAALRFYEEKQLIWSVRTEGNQRRYQRAILRRISIIKVAQQVGMSLQDVKTAFAVLPKNQVASKADWQKMSQQWQANLNTKIINLLQLRQQLDWCIGCGCLSLEQCPLRNPNDQLADESAGAHFQELLLQFEDKKQQPLLDSQNYVDDELV